MKLLLILLMMTPALLIAQTNETVPTDVEVAPEENKIEPLPLPEKQEENKIENPFKIGPYKAGVYQFPKEEEENEN